MLPHLLIWFTTYWIKHPFLYDSSNSVLECIWTRRGKKSILVFLKIFIWTMSLLLFSGFQIWTSEQIKNIFFEFIWSFVSVFEIKKLNFNLNWIWNRKFGWTKHSVKRKNSSKLILELETLLIAYIDNTKVDKL